MKSLRNILYLCFVPVLFSCRNNDYRDSKYQPLSDSVSMFGFTGDSAKLVKTAGIDFKVKDVMQTVKAVSVLANGFGGIIHYQNTTAHEEGQKELRLSTDSLLLITAFSPQAEITARIPSANLEAFLFDVPGLGYHTGSSRLQVDDRSLLYRQNVLRQKARDEVLARAPLVAGKSAATKQLLDIKDQQTDQQIANRQINADVAYSTVNLRLYQNPVVRREVVADTDMNRYALPFVQRLTQALAGGWQLFLNLLIAFAYLWMFLLAGVAVYFGYRFWQRKQGPKLAPVGKITSH